MREDKKVLLHCCCAICSAHPITYLKELGYEPISYFYNPNIYPEVEHTLRLHAQKQLCKSLDCELIIEDYTPELYKEITTGYELEPEKGKRCKRCFELRLLRTAQKAQDLGIKSYATSISTSPKKDFNTISEIGGKFSKYFNIEFLNIDFKKKDGFLKSNKITKELNLYRQNYCGCSLSQRLFED